MSREATEILLDAPIVETSDLAVSVDQLWRHMTSMDGVNYELMPIVRMSFPAHWQRLDAHSLPSGTVLFHSTIMLLGVLPIDRHALALLTMTPHTGFLEHSTSLFNRAWVHERMLEPVDGGTRITDRVGFRCRLAGLEPLLRPVIQSIFRHRYKRLRHRFGELTRASTK